MKAPKKIALSTKAPSKAGKITVTIQNHGTEVESIPSLDALTALVSVEVETLGTNCPSFAASLVARRKAAFPIDLAPKKSLTLTYQATFNCANDPLATSKTANHNDFKVVATLDLSALDEIDTTDSNNVCPRPPNPAIGDPGCGAKTAAQSIGWGCCD